MGFWSVVNITACDAAMVPHKHEGDSPLLEDILHGGTGGTMLCNAVHVAGLPLEMMRGMNQGFFSEEVHKESLIRSS